MQQVDILITHGLLVTVDPRMNILQDGALAIRGTDIVEVGTSAGLATRYEAQTVLDATNKIVMPGLINAHTHTPAVIFRGLFEDLRLEPWLQKAWRYEGRFMNPTNVRIGAQLAQAEMIRGGTTTALDMYWFPEVMAQVAQQTGFRLMTGPSYIDIPNPPDKLAVKERTPRGREFLQQYKNDPLIISCVQPHSTYTVAYAQLIEARELAQEFGVFINTHCSETVVEVQTVAKNSDMSPPRLLDKLGLLSGKTVLAHCVHLAPDEIDLVASRESAVAHCPISNLKLAGAAAPVLAMKEKGVKVAFGTDGAQSSNDLNLWNDLRFGAILQKSVSGDPTVMPASEVVRMATRGAAQAIGQEDKLGALEAGKRADVVLLDLEPLHSLPLYEVYSQLVHSMGRDNVTTMIVNGRILMRDRELMTINETGLVSQVQALAEEVRAFQTLE